MERLADILEKINKEKRVKELIKWIQNKDTDAARNFKKIVSEGEIQSIRAYKLNNETLNILETSPMIKYYSNDKAIWINNYKGGRQSRKIRKSRRATIGNNKESRKKKCIWY